MRISGRQAKVGDRLQDHQDEFLELVGQSGKSSSVVVAKARLLKSVFVYGFYPEAGFNYFCFSVNGRAEKVGNDEVKQQNDLLLNFLPYELLPF